MNESGVLRPPRAVLPKLTDRYALGPHGLEVSPICLGMTDDPDTIGAAFDAGVNFFFLTADMHWPLYESTRRGLIDLLRRSPRVRDEIAVAVTAYVAQPEFLHAPFQEVIDAVPGLGHIDVAVAGGAYAVDFFTRMVVFERDYRRGRQLGCRAIGASFHDRPTCALATSSGLTDISYVRYNAAHAGARAEVFPLLSANPPTLLYSFKSTTPFFTGPSDPAVRVTDHYRFVLTRPELDGILCSPTRPAMVTELADALDEGPLDEAEEEAFVRSRGQSYRPAPAASAPATPWDD
jgi:hypothetical protein